MGDEADGVTPFQRLHLLNRASPLRTTRNRLTIHDKGGVEDARSKAIAYEYLCHLEETKRWLEACLNDSLPNCSKLEEALRNGVILARLAMFFAPEVVKQKMIFDYDQKIYEDRGVIYRHTDNLMRWLRAMKYMEFPDIYHPSVTDCYEQKNMPRVIYCIHALSWFLYRKGISPQIENLKGVAKFTDEEVNQMHSKIGQTGMQLPAFGELSNAESLMVDNVKPKTPPPPPPLPYYVAWPFALEFWEPWRDLDTSDPNDTYLTEEERLSLRRKDASFSVELLDETFAHVIEEVEQRVLRKLRKKESKIPLLSPSELSEMDSALNEDESDFVQEIGNPYYGLYWDHMYWGWPDLYNVTWPFVANELFISDRDDSDCAAAVNEVLAKRRFVLSLSLQTPFDISPDFSRALPAPDDSMSVETLIKMCFPETFKIIDELNYNVEEFDEDDLFDAEFNNELFDANYARISFISESGGDEETEDPGKRGFARTQSETILLEQQREFTLRSEVYMPPPEFQWDRMWWGVTEESERKARIKLPDLRDQPVTSSSSLTQALALEPSRQADSAVSLSPQKKPNSGAGITRSTSLRPASKPPPHLFNPSASYSRQTITVTPAEPEKLVSIGEGAALELPKSPIVAAASPRTKRMLPKPPVKSESLQPEVPAIIPVSPSGLRRALPLITPKSPAAPASPAKIRGKGKKPPSAKVLASRKGKTSIDLQDAFGGRNPFLGDLTGKFTESMIEEEQQIDESAFGNSVEDALSEASHLGPTPVETPKPTEEQTNTAPRPIEPTQKQNESVKQIIQSFEGDVQHASATDVEASISSLRNELTTLEATNQDGAHSQAIEEVRIEMKLLEERLAALSPRIAAALANDSQPPPSTVNTEETNKRLSVSEELLRQSSVIESQLMSTAPTTGGTFSTLTIQRGKRTSSFGISGPPVASKPRTASFTFQSSATAPITAPITAPSPVVILPSPASTGVQALGNEVGGPVVFDLRALTDIRMLEAAMERARSAASSSSSSSSHLHQQQQQQQQQQQLSTPSGSVTGRTNKGRSPEQVAAEIAMIERELALLAADDDAHDTGLTPCEDGVDFI